MSREHVESLISYLERSATLLHELGARMKQQRKAFVALSGDALAAAVEELRELADIARSHDKERETATRALSASLGIEAPITVSRLLPRLPPDLARRLTQARDVAKAAARALHVEAGVGARLLCFAQETQEALLQRFVRMQETETKSYDKNARTIAGATSGGRLVKGVI